MSKFTKAPFAFLRRFRKDESGLSLVEFALVSPALLSMYLGAIVVTHMEHASTAVGKVTGTVGDIVAQSPTVDRNILNGAMKAADALMGQQFRGEVELVITGVVVEPVPGSRGNNPPRRGRVVWSASRNRKTLPQRGTGSNYPLPDWAKRRSGFFVAAQGRLQQTPLYGDFFGVGDGGKMTYNYENLFVPRTSLDINCSDC